VNPAAIERMVLVKGGYGRVVWLPTFDAENQVRYSKENRPFVPVTRSGALLPEVREVIALAAKHGLTLETGHSSAAECLRIVREARRAGVKNVVVTHAMLAPIHMSVAQMKEAADMGAWIEFVYNALIGSNREFTFEEYANAIREVGAEHCILSSDLGQAANPVHTEGLVTFFAGLEKAGVRRAEIERMSRENPARALGL
jgi:predicted metal-dependent TIM-barrel fold hydrolase